METKKVLGIIFSILFIGAFAFVLSWGIVNFNKVKDGMSGTGVYTKEDVDSAYSDGYNTALSDKKEYTELIDSYRDTITVQTDEISKLNSEVSLLTNSNNDYSNQIAKLETQKSNLTEQVKNLNEIKTNNETTISSLNKQILDLQNEIVSLENNKLNNEDIILQKNNQIYNLQATVSQLQKTNDLNVETIANLNNQIASLNTQITDMTMQIQNNLTNVNALNNKISQLEKSVAYYEQYIANFENTEQVVATFEFDGSVYNIQIVNKNSTVSVVTPTSTDYVIFNYWTVNGQQIDLSEYQITSNVKIVANVTYNYDVKFMVDDSEYNSQIIIKNGYSTIPENPTKDGYDFDGWTINGVDIINPNTYAITQNTTFIAKFTKLHTVTFMYENEVINTQTIRNGNYANSVSVDNTTYKVFNGWTYNGTIINLDNFKITSSTTLIANITYYYDVTFIVEDEVYNTQIVVENGLVNLPETPSKSSYKFDGWTVDGDIIDLATYQINHNTTFVALYHQYIYKFTLEDSHSTLFNEELNEQIDDIIANERNLIISFSITYTNDLGGTACVNKQQLNIIKFKGSHSADNCSVNLSNGSETIHYSLTYSSDTGLEIYFTSSFTHKVNNFITTTYKFTSAEFTIITE